MGFLCCCWQSACGSATGGPDGQDPATDRAGEPGAGPTSSSGTPEVAALVFGTPGDKPADPWELDLADIPSGTVSSIGSGFDASDIADGSTGVLAWVSDGRSKVQDFKGDRATAPLAGEVYPEAALRSPEGVLVQDGDWVALLRDGHTIDRFKLPDITATAKAPDRQKGVYTGGPGTVQGFALNSEGQPIAVAYTGRGADLENLVTGKVAPLERYIAVRSVSMGGDGAMYVLAFDPYASDSSFVLLKYDIETLQLQRVWDTGLKATDDVDSAGLVTVPGSKVVVTVARGNEKPITMSVLVLDGAELREVPGVPVDLGLRAVPAGTDAVYVFGGPAGSEVSRLDLTTASVEPVFRGMEPKKSYVLAVELR